MFKEIAQKYKNEKKDREEYEAIIEKNRQLKIDDVNKANISIRCPLCGNTTFYDGMYPLTYGYMEADRPVTHIKIVYNYLPVADKDGGEIYMHAKKENNNIPLKTKVCKRCGYVFQQIDFSGIDDLSYSAKCFDKHIQVGEAK